jgi:phage anti-repressor protein
MSNWIFIATNQKADGRTYTAREIYEQRMHDSFWGLGERTPNRRNIQSGDRIVFYLGTPECVFAGTAITESPSYKLSQGERRKVSRGGRVFETEYGVNLRDIDIWETPKLVPELVGELDFIENEDHWGTYFQGGVRGITDRDYSVIVDGAKAESRIADDEKGEIENAKQFALEAHLEEFIHSNWGKIDWGRSLRLYETPESDGRQFPAGTWSIDFLAIDNEDDSLVVIELKRGRTSDAVIGQTLRYMGWLKRNLAREGQQVKGIIICHEPDDALRYAVSQVPGISVLTYQVDFHLTTMLA